MQCFVGLPVHSRKIGASASMQRDADRHTEGGADQRHPLPGQSAEDTPGDFRGALGIAIGGEDQEFVAQPRAFIALAHAIANGFRDARNDRISGGVTAHIVDHLEIVDVDEQHRPLPGMPLHRLFDDLHGATTIQQSGQAVAN